QRPASLPMPELDRLRAQSIYVETAFQSAPETSEAMLSILAGRPVYGVEERGKASLRLLSLDQRPEDWPGLPNLFTRARDAGANTAVVGWFLPYCRLFAGELN